MTEANEDEDKDDCNGERSQTEGRQLLDRIATELRRLHASQATGELAALRRMDRRSVPPAAFYRLIARAGMTEAGPEAVRRWAHIVSVMAQRPDALRLAGLGASLKSIGVSETRLDMLLNARGPALQDLARRTGLRLARSEEGLPYRDLCELLFYDGRNGSGDDKRADDVRIRVAQSFQRKALDDD